MLCQRRQQKKKKKTLQSVAESCQTLIKISRKNTKDVSLIFPLFVSLPKKDPKDPRNLTQVSFNLSVTVLLIF